MSDSKQTNSDRAMARLLADALRRPADVASDSGCPDAGILAAYAEHNLDVAETSQWEKHFADCGRCQKILAVLTVSGEEPLTGAELERFGRKVAAVEVGAPAVVSSGKKKATQFARPQTAWPWLASAVGIAAAVALWIALRPIPRPSSVAITAQSDITEPAAPPLPNESLEARANVPPPPAAAEQDAMQQQRKSLEAAGALKKENSQAGQAAPAPRPAEAQDQTVQVTEEAPLVQAQPVLQAANKNKTADEPARAKQSEETAGASRSAASSAAPLTAVVSPSPAASADASPGVAAPQSSASNAAQAAAAGNATPENKSATNRTVQLFAARQALAGVAANAPGRIVTLTSPGANVSWRAGPRGEIKRSTDHGRTWQPEASGVTSDLLAGVAPADTVAWIAGRAGVILRTTDGEHWQRIPSPDPSADWAAVQAADARHATITSSDQRHFATEDGGQTWTPQ